MSLKAAEEELAPFKTNASGYSWVFACLQERKYANLFVDTDGTWRIQWQDWGTAVIVPGNDLAELHRDVVKALLEARPDPTLSGFEPATTPPTSSVQRTAKCRHSYANSGARPAATTCHRSSRRGPATDSTACLHSARQLT